MLRLSDFAKRDLQEIWEYLAEYGTDTAHKTLRELSKKFNLLAANPKLGRVRPEHLIEMRSFPYKRFMIYRTYARSVRQAASLSGLG